MTLDRRYFVRWSAQPGAGLASAPLRQACSGGWPTGASVAPPLAVHNAYRQTNLAASKASYGAAITFPDRVDAWGIPTLPTGAGGHFWALGGGSPWQFVVNVSASADPKLSTLFREGLGEVDLSGADALNTGTSLGMSTGTAFNGAPIDSNHFRVTAQMAGVNGAVLAFDGSARFMFVTDSGQLSACTHRARDGSTVRVNDPARLMYDGRALGMSIFGVALNTDTWDSRGSPISAARRRSASSTRPGNTCPRRASRTRLPTARRSTRRTRRRAARSSQASRCRSTSTCPAAGCS